MMASLTFQELSSVPHEMLDYVSLRGFEVTDASTRVEERSRVVDGGRKETKMAIE